MPARFSTRPMGDWPVFRIAPHGTHMASAYRDRTGRCHSFTDFIDHERQTAFDLVIDSFDAVLPARSVPEVRCRRSSITATVRAHAAAPWTPSSLVADVSAKSRSCSACSSRLWYWTARAS